VFRQHSKGREVRIADFPAFVILGVSLGVHLPHSVGRHCYIQHTLHAQSMRIDPLRSRFKFEQIPEKVVSDTCQSHQPDIAGIGFQQRFRAQAAHARRTI